MGFFVQNVFVEVICLVILCLWSFYWYLTKNYGYWEKRGVLYKKPEFPFGSTKDFALAKDFHGKLHEQIYKQYKNEPFYGIIEFRKPVLVVKNPEFIKQILVKDFQYFMDRPVLIGNPDEHIIKSLLVLEGQEWKNIRAKLTPTFTSGKIKLMFPLIEKCSETLKKQIEVEIENKNNVLDAKNLLARFTLEIIASCAFGIETNSITDKNAEFYSIFGDAMSTTKLRFMRRMFLIIFPSILRIFRINLVRPQVRDFVTNIVRHTIEYRQKNKIKRNDFLDLLINARQNKNIEENEQAIEGSNHKINEVLNIDQMTAHTYVFFVAGFETASSLLSFSLYELARNKDIQDKLYKEIQEVVDRNGGKISYQMLMEVHYLDQVINETLRMYGAGQTLTRVCTQTYRVPETDLVLEKGLKVLIPLYALHHDPQYYPDPYSFNPDRFTVEETKKRHPYVFMPFGEGPRNCIGMRFGLIEAKMGLTTVNFHVDLAPEQEVPIKFNKRSVVIMPANPVLLKFTKRDDH